MSKFKIGDIIVNGPKDHYMWTSRKNNAVMEVIKTRPGSERDIYVKIISGNNQVGNMWWVNSHLFVLQKPLTPEEKAEKFFWDGVKEFEGIAQ